MTVDDRQMIEQLESLLECLAEGDIESVQCWLRAAIGNIERNEWPEEFDNAA